MPIYEYQCTSCHGTLELLQRVNDPAPSRCESCGSEKPLEKVVSHTSFQLKGGGWYNDLYSSSKGSAKAKDEPNKSTPPKKEETKSTKPSD